MRRIKLVEAEQSEDQLVELIATLNKAEKRYFKILTTAFPGSKSYLKLFNAIEKTGSLESKQVKRILRGKSVRQISDIKRYLFNLILRSLSIQNRDDSIEKKIQIDIQNITHLFKRGLYKSAQSLIYKNLGLAEKHSFHHLCYQLKLQELNLLMYTSSYDEIINNLSANQEYISKNLDAEKERISYQMLRFKWFSFIRKNEEVYYNPKAHRTIKNFMSHPLLSEENIPNGLEAKVIYYLINIVYARISNQRKKQLFYSKQSVKIWKNYKSLETNPPMGYLGALRNLAVAASENYRVDVLKSCVRKAKAVNANNMRQMKEIEIITNIIPMSYNNKVGLFKKNKSIYNKYDKDEPAFLSCMNVTDKLNWYYELALTAFGLEDFKTAIFWLIKTLNHKVKNIRLDIEAVSNMLLIISHFELKNYEVVSALTLKTKRFLVKRELLGPFENDLLNFFIKTSSQSQKNITKTDIETFILENLVTLQKKYKDRVITAVNDKSHVELFNFTAWIRSKTDGISLAEAIQQLKEPSQPFVLVD